jgi:hypothetical protein
MYPHNDLAGRSGRVLPLSIPRWAAVLPPHLQIYVRAQGIRPTLMTHGVVSVV